MKLIKRIKLTLLFSMLACCLCFETKTETEEKISNTINISEGNMKHRKSGMRTRKAEKLYLSKLENPSTAISPNAQSNGSGQSDGVSSNQGVGKSSNLLDVATGNKNSAQPKEQAKLGDGPIFFSGWMKYFKFSETSQSGSTPKHFFRNNQFYEQKKLFPKADLNETSSDGVNTLNTFIKSPSHFYVVLFKSNVNFVSGRQAEILKTYDILNIEYIKPVQENSGLGARGPNKNNQNGIQDFGNFSEGFCLKVLTSKPKTETWVICADTEQEKEKFMSLLKQLKMQQQLRSGQMPPLPPGARKTETISSLLNPSQGSSQNLKSDGSGNMGVGFGSNQKITDGYWIVLQDWSQCSLKCGGGYSYLQRMCVPPKSGGAPCEGEAVMNKTCNTQPCPNVMGTDPLKPNNNTFVQKPIVKIMPFSSRPQRYSKCVIKESDLMYTQDMGKKEDQSNPFLKSSSKDVQKLQIPTRVVMNNKTVTIFGGESYDTQIKTFSLEHTNFKRSASNPSCFYLTESNKKAELCPFGYNPKGSKMVEEWDYDFNLFKHQCATPRDKIAINLQMEKKLNDKLNEKMKKAKKELLEEREREIKKRVAKQEQTQIEKVVKSTNQVALQAIQKEINLEEMIKQEEAEREQREEVEMMKKIEEEKKKSECLMKAIKERQLENQYNLKAKSAEEEVNSIKQAAQQQVMIRRSQLKNLIDKMRKQSQRRKAKLAKQLVEVRSVMAKTMGKVARKGDTNKCVTAAKGETEKLAYCQANFLDEYSEMENCKETDDFCTLCCDTEFGDLHMNERQQCYKTVCPLVAPKNSSSAPAGPTNIQGRWIWQNGVN